jgi:hypothetical protein
MSGDRVNKQDLCLRAPAPLKAALSNSPSTGFRAGAQSSIPAWFSVAGRQLSPWLQLPGSPHFQGGLSGIAAAPFCHKSSQNQ